MWYNLYLLASISTSFLESTSISAKIIYQSMHGNDQALEAAVEIPDLTSSVSRYISDMPNFSKFTKTISEKKSTSISTKIIYQSMHGNDQALEAAVKIPDLTSSVSRYISDLPNFSKFTKTISEKKCMEYVYEMLKRQEIKNLEYSGSQDVDIINGKVVHVAEFPHMGALGWRHWAGSNLVFLCGASLISDSFMLTAAHCTSVTRKDLVHRKPHLVRLGSRYLEKSPHEMAKDIRIRKLIQHPYYNSVTKYYDLALVELDEKVDFTKFIQPACLPSKGNYLSSGKPLIATGWGSVKARKHGLAMSNELRSATVHVIDRNTCNELVEKFSNRHWRGLQPHQMCAGELDGSADTCQGDSGGPLQYLLVNTTSEGNIHRLMSVTSYGVSGCATANVPGIYTDISYYYIIEWIESIAWPGE